MRVLIVSHGHPDYSIGGAEVASYTLFQALRAAGHDAFYLARVPTGVRRHAATPLMSLRHSPHEAFLDTTGWDEFWLSNTGFAQSGPALVDLLEDFKPDVVHFHHVIGFGVELLSLVKRVLPDAKLVLTFHEYLAICAHHGQMITPAGKLCHGASPASCSRCFPEKSSAAFFAREQHLRNHLALADAFISPSHFLADRYVAWGLPRDRFSVIENGLSNHAQQARPKRSGVARKRLAFFGQVSEFKGLHILLEAVSRIPDELWGDASLSVFGGNLEHQPEAFRSRFNALLGQTGKRVRFLGSYRQAELPALMTEVDWVVMPSIWWENSPVVVQEAFLHGRPLIVSGIGGMAEKVRHEVDGLHFRVGNPESLADTIARALTEPELWARLSEQAPKPLAAADAAAKHVQLFRLLNASSEQQYLTQVA